MIVWQRRAVPERQPRLWVCRVGERYVLVDSWGPRADRAVDEGMVVAVAATMTVGEAERYWRRHRRAVLARRQGR